MADRLSTCILAAVTCLGIGALWASRADAQEAQVPCKPIGELREYLKSKHNEVEVGGGLYNEQAIVTVFASPEGETWTMVAVGPNGMACYMSDGTNWFPGTLPEGEGV